MVDPIGPIALSAAYGNRGSPLAPDAVGFVALHPRRGDRLALFHPSGELSNSFAADEHHEAVAAILARNGLRLAPDGAVFRVAAS